MERYLVTQGACTSLLSIANSALWPPTLRDMAAGQLLFHMEALFNVQHLGDEVADAAAVAAASSAAATRARSAAGSPSLGTVRLAGATAAATPAAEASLRYPGLQPVMATLVALMNTGHALLELRGACGLARLCLHEPSGTQPPVGLLAEVKASAPELGAISALIELLKRVVARWASSAQQPCSGPCLRVLAVSDALPDGCC